MQRKNKIFLYLNDLNEEMIYVKNKIVLLMLIIGILFSVSVVSAADADNIKLMQSSELDDDCRVINIDAGNTNLMQSSALSIGKSGKYFNNDGFKQLQKNVDCAKSNSTLYLNHDYKGSNYECVKINKDLTIDGQGHTIDCMNKNNCRVFESVSGNVTLKNLKITNCKIGSILISGNAQYTIENCTFINNKGHQGAAITNYAGTTLNIKDSLFKFNNATDLGGAIYTDGVLNMENCKVISNSAGNSGGAIFAKKEVTIIGSELSKNHANDRGGALKSEGKVNLVKDIINDNVAENAGGGVFTTDNIDVMNSTCSNNKAYASGGALLGDIITIKDTGSTRSKFINNSVRYDGGALYGMDSVVLTNVDFCCNNAEDGCDAFTCDWQVFVKKGVKCFINGESGLVEIPVKWGHFSSLYGCLYQYRN